VNIEELGEKYGTDWAWLYLNDQVKVKHAVDVVREGSWQFRTADCGTGPVWYEGIGWRGLRTPAEKERADALPECKRCIDRLSRKKAGSAEGGTIRPGVISGQGNGASRPRTPLTDRRNGAQSGRRFEGKP
jgi:hypothetical protein